MINNNNNNNQIKNVLYRKNQNSLFLPFFFSPILFKFSFFFKKKQPFSILFYSISLYVNFFFLYSTFHISIFFLLIFCIIISFLFIYKKHIKYTYISIYFIWLFSTIYNYEMDNVLPYEIT